VSEQEGLESPAIRESADEKVIVPAPFEKVAS